jgi:hypothetical protein
MSMYGFQKAMCDLAASPDLCLLMKESPEQVLSRYDLSARDRRRLVSVVRQRGMLVNCSLYRANRLSPIYNLMPHTCFLLGDALMDELTEFWTDFDESRLQFDEEARKFGKFLRRRIKLGFQKSVILADVLEYELALNEFRYNARNAVLKQLARTDVPSDGGAGVRLHPLIRVLLFRYEPSRIFDLLNERQSPPYELDQGEFWLLLDGRKEVLETSLIDAGVGRLLHAIATQTHPSLSKDDAEILLDAGFVVRVALTDTMQQQPIVRGNEAHTKSRAAHDRYSKGR